MSRRGLFGWSYPPGCSGPPDYPDPPVFRCEKCGSFLHQKSDHVQIIEDKLPCNGIPVDVERGGITACGEQYRHPPHEHIVNVVHKHTRVCKNCSHENVSIDC